VSMRLTSVTVLLLALVWLPFLLKVLALSGGGLKALGGGITSVSWTGSVYATATPSIVASS
jgi:hypothetical protein